MIEFLLTLLKVKRNFWLKVTTDYGRGRSDAYQDMIKELENVNEPQ